MAGAPLAEAHDAAQARQRDFDPAATLALLIAGQAITALP
jgi:hypothetical protein